jgi:hypothetical protein
MTSKRTAPAAPVAEAAAPADGGSDAPRVTYPLSVGPMDPEVDHMIQASHVQEDGRTPLNEARKGEEG